VELILHDCLPYFSGLFIGQIAADVDNVNDCFTLCNTLRKIIWGVLFFGLWIVSGYIVGIVVDNGKRAESPHRIGLWIMWIMFISYIAKGCIFVVLIPQML
jgi:hypothetical protein